MVATLEMPPAGTATAEIKLLKQLFTCENREFVWNVVKCDGISQCRDNSDEKNCKWSTFM